MKLREHSFLLGFFFFMITIASIIFYEVSYIETNIEFRIFYFLGFIVSVILIVGIIGIANDERNGRPSKAIKSNSVNIWNLTTSRLPSTYGDENE